MHKLRKLFRGSGRALAFVFVASVVWLLFDMAALRLSFGDAAGQRALAAAGRGQRERGRLWRGSPGPAGGGRRDPGPPRAAAPREPGGGRAAESATAAAAEGSPAGGAARRAASGTAGPPPGSPQPSAAKGRAGGSLRPAAPRRDGRSPAAAAARSDVAPAASGPPARAARTAAGAVASTARLPGAPPATASAGGPRDRALSPDLPAPEPAEQAGAGAAVPEGAAHAAHGSLAPPGSPAHRASRAPWHRGARVGEAAASPEKYFVLIGKAGAKPSSSAAAPSPGSDAVPNSWRSPEARGAQELAATRLSTTLATGTTGRAAAPRSPARGSPGAAGAGPAGDAGGAAEQGRQGVAGSSSRAARPGGSPGTHRVLAVDATLAPRDPQAPGQFGHPVAVPEDKQEEAKSRWKEGNFNVYLSDLIPVDRAVADTRPAGCSEQRVHDDLPTTTIIMCFVDEVWSTLLRSVHSVLSRSPPHLVEEIILVDDFSTKEYLKEKLDAYMSRFPKVKILHLKERHGLIRARLAGAQIAKGDVLTFLDSHVECNVGWLEPLLERVRLSRAKVACPVIEVISDKDMSYMTVDNFQRGIFTWPMNFGWRQIPQEVIEKNKIKETDIIRCPVMAGGLFSIDKKYFFELGTYDSGLDVWGGENMEISFKVWMCGGEIEIIPCSRVGHIFRNDNPYSFPKDRIRTVERNLARVAEVWLDEYKELFYGHAYHLVLRRLDVGDLTQQIALRKKLQCRSFRWYLENVYPDLEAPLVKASGLVVNIATARCITVENTTLAFQTCDVNNEDQKFNYTWLRLLQHGDLCIAPAGTTGALELRPCAGWESSLAWQHSSLAAARPELADHLVSEHLQPPACLEVDPSLQALRVSACNSANPYQKWQFGNYYAD
uniref:Polypeptide N-acetylgalactosaminyltransferase n=1 Tax=Cairina moschata TaxID=8855 RepID=A0A8C3CYX3_CAIMO